MLSPTSSPPPACRIAAAEPPRLPLRVAHVASHNPLTNQTDVRLAGIKVRSRKHFGRNKASRPVIVSRCPSWPGRSAFLLITLLSSILGTYAACYYARLSAARGISLFCNTQAIYGICKSNLGVHRPSYSNLNQ
eukprot:1663017-Pyramimonas_sp.AAC.1